MAQGSFKYAYQCVIKHSALSGFSNQLRIQKARKEPLFLIKDKLRAKDWAATQLGGAAGKDFIGEYLMLLECTEDTCRPTPACAAQEAASGGDRASGSACTFAPALLWCTGPEHERAWEGI